MRSISILKVVMKMMKMQYLMKISTLDKSIEMNKIEAIVEKEASDKILRCMNKI